MILKKLILSPFAGTNDREIVFQNGLNVIEGPNEAGKSTLVKAIEFVLFYPTNLTPAKERNLIENYLPVVGSDTINISLEFEINGISHILSKNWGATKSSKLQISGSGTLTNPDTINDKIKELLALNEATWKNVLFAHQAALKDTISEINKSTDIKGTFSDLLGNAVIMAGGISPEALRTSLENTIAEYYSNWDEYLNRPRDGKGIDNKWKNKVGQILKAYYLLHDKKKEIEEREEYDIEYDRIVNEIETNKPKINELKAWVEEHKPLLEDAKTRNDTELKIRVLNAECETVKADAKKWPELIANVNHATENIKNLEADIKKLGIELEVAVKKESSMSKNEKYQVVKGKNIVAEKEREILKKLIHIEEDNITSAVEFQETIGKCDLKLEAQKLRVLISPKKTFIASMKKGVETIADYHFETGKTFDEVVPGKFRIETDAFTFEVVSGQVDIDTLISDRQKALDFLATLLKKYKVEDIEELKALDKKVKDQNQKIKVLEDDIKAILGNETFDSLQKAMEELEILPSTRDSASIRSNIGEKKEIKTKSETIRDLDQKTIEELGTKYGSQDKLMDKLVEKNAELSTFKSQLEKLKPMPANLTNIQEFIDDFEAKKLELDNLKGGENKLMTKKAVLEASVPEKSNPELKEESTLLEKEFKRRIEEGNAHRTILKKTKLILDKNNSTMFEPYYESTSRYFGTISQGRYNKVVMNGVIPEEITDGKITLRQSLLSQGTQDALALSLRLSMAEYYLKESKGFLIMDDPLTDMDASRQQSAANCIKQFATEKQVILFTCHPSHADILGGNRLSLKY